MARKNLKKQALSKAMVLMAVSTAVSNVTGMISFADTADAGENQNQQEDTQAEEPQTNAEIKTENAASAVINQESGVSKEEAPELSVAEPTAPSEPTKEQAEAFNQSVDGFNQNVKDTNALINEYNTNAEAAADAINQAVDAANAENDSIITTIVTDGTTDAQGVHVNSNVEILAANGDAYTFNDGKLTDGQGNPVKDLSGTEMEAPEAPAAPTETMPPTGTAEEKNQAVVDYNSAVDTYNSLVTIKNTEIAALQNKLNNYLLMGANSAVIEDNNTNISANAETIDAADFRKIDAVLTQAEQSELADTIAADPAVSSALALCGENADLNTLLTKMKQYELLFDINADFNENIKADGTVDTYNAAAADYRTLKAGFEAYVSAYSSALDDHTVTEITGVNTAITDNAALEALFADTAAAGSGDAWTAAKAAYDAYIQAAEGADASAKDILTGAGVSIDASADELAAYEAALALYQDFLTKADAYQKAKAESIIDDDKEIVKADSDVITQMTGVIGSMLANGSFVTVAQEKDGLYYSTSAKVDVSADGTSIKIVDQSENVTTITLTKDAQNAITSVTIGETTLNISDFKRFAAEIESGQFVEAQSAYMTGTAVTDRSFNEAVADYLAEKAKAATVLGALKTAIGAYSEMSTTAVKKDTNGSISLINPDAVFVPTTGANNATEKNVDAALIVDTDHPDIRPMIWSADPLSYKEADKLLKLAISNSTIADALKLSYFSGDLDPALYSHGVGENHLFAAQDKINKESGSGSMSCKAKDSAGNGCTLHVWYKPNGQLDIHDDHNDFGYAIVNLGIERYTKITIGALGELGDFSTGIVRPVSYAAHEEAAATLTTKDFEAIETVTDLTKTQETVLKTFGQLKKLSKGKDAQGEDIPIVYQDRVKAEKLYEYKLADRITVPEEEPVGGISDEVGGNGGGSGSGGGGGNGGGGSGAGTGRTAYNFGTPDTTIADTETPLAGAEVLGIEDADVPLAAAPFGVLGIMDGPVPLAALPMTSDTRNTEALVFALSALSFLGLAYTGKKREEA